MILVTGATGFLGRNLCEFLVARGRAIRALVRPQSNYAFLEELGVELAWGDIREAETLAAAVRGCEAVIHAAAKFRFWGPWEEFYAANVVGTRNMLEASCREGVGRFIYISTIAVVGRPAPNLVITEEHPCTPLDHYQRTKLEAETMALRYYRERGLPVIVLRLGALYGPWGHYALNRLLFEDFLHGLRVRVHGGRHITFPLFVKDAAATIDTSLEKGRPGEIYNVSGQSIPQREANTIICRLAGKRDWWINVPGALMVALARAWTFLSNFTKKEPWYPINLYPYVFYDWPVSSEKARLELGFRPRSFEEGAYETLKWYAHFGLGKGPVIPVLELQEGRGEREPEPLH